MPADGTPSPELKPVEAYQTGMPHEPRPYDELHHPHGYAHEKERHHWYWYGGLLVFGLGLLIAPVIWWQMDTASGPLCTKENAQALASPDGRYEIELANVSCFGGHAQQKVFMRHIDGRMTIGQSVASFDERAKIRIRWLNDTQIVITQRKGRIWSFQPKWADVKIRYV